MALKENKSKILLDINKLPKNINRKQKIGEFISNEIMESKRIDEHHKNSIYENDLDDEINSGVNSFSCFKSKPGKKLNHMQKSCGIVKEEMEYTNKINYKPDILSDMDGYLCNNSNVIIQQTTNIKKRNALQSDDTVSNKNSNLEQRELKELAELISEVINLKVINKKLHYHNHTYYKIIDYETLLTLFMQEIDISVLNAKKLRPIKEVYNYLSASPLLKEDDVKIDKYKYYAAFDNIVVDVEKWEFHEHSPDRIILSSVNAKIKSNPSAPVFSKFLSDVTNHDPVLIKRMWEFIGYLFIQSIDAKAIFVMGTASNSGKSLLCRFLLHLFDEDLTNNLSISDFGDKFWSGGIEGVVLNVAPDLPTEALNDKAIGIIKALTGDDKIMSKNKYKNAKKYRNRAKFVFTTNHPLKLSINDNALWERVVILPFLNSVPKSEQNWRLQELFEQEKDDIVTIALYHCHNLIKNNFVFSTNTTIKCIENKWKGDSNGLIELFLTEACIITGDDNDRVLMSEMYIKYSEFCEKYSVRKVGEKMFSSYIENEVDRVDRKRYRFDGSNPRSCCCGIKIKLNNRIVLPKIYDDDYCIKQVYNKQYSYVNT
jgi:putative DNA primase/helicase